MVGQLVKKCSMKLVWCGISDWARSGRHKTTNNSIVGINWESSERYYILWVQQATRSNDCFGCMGYRFQLFKMLVSQNKNAKTKALPYCPHQRPLSPWAPKLVTHPCNASFHYLPYLSPTELEHYLSIEYWVDGYKKESFALKKQ